MRCYWQEGRLLGVPNVMVFNDKSKEILLNFEVITNAV